MSFILPQVIPHFLFSYLALNPSFLPLSYHLLCVFPYNPPFLFPPFLLCVLPYLFGSFLLIYLLSPLTSSCSSFILSSFSFLLVFFFWYHFLSYLASLSPSFFAPLFAFGCISHNLFLYLFGKWDGEQPRGDVPIRVHALMCKYYMTLWKWFVCDSMEQWGRD